MPYKEKDTLVFTSTNGDTDTFFLRKPKRYMQYEVDPLSLKKPDSTETLDVSYKYNFFDTVQKIDNFRVGPLIIFQRTKEDITNVGFSTLQDAADFCGLTYFSIDHLNKMQLTNFKTSIKEYDDVFIIEQNLNCSSTSKIFWSKSNGLVGFEKGNNNQYSLTRKYGL